MKTCILFLVWSLFLIGSFSEGKRVVCYFTSWAGYRGGDGKFTPDEFDPSKCTNVLYAFASLDNNTLTIVPSDAYLDIDQNYYKKVVSKCKSNSRCKPSLSLGGWTDSSGDKYSRMLNNAAARSKFVSTTVQYLQKYGFEGLDIDIEYPSCPQGDCGSGNPNDKASYVLLFQELRQEFTRRRWVLSAAIGSYQQVIDAGYDLKGLSDNMDWIGVMTYDYHSSTEKQTGPVSPLKTTAGDKFAKSNTVESMNYIISKGARKEKLVVGLPAYGYNYRLASSSQNGYWAPAVGQGPAGPFTNSPGTLSFYEICQKIRNEGWTKVENSALGAYAFKADNWVSYNSIKDIMNKADYVKTNGYAGLMVWDISQDDFSGSFCGQGRFPVLTAMNNYLK